MEIKFIKSCDSTQTYVKNLAKNLENFVPFALVSEIQTNGFGSRGNLWESGKENLHFSFCFDEKFLPQDLPLQSISIYFATIFKEILRNFGSKIWVKWPNDFYIKDKKIGGIMTQKFGEIFVCGIGLNLKNSPQNSAILDIEIDKNFIVNEFCKEIESKKSWKLIFSKFLVEFELSKDFTSHMNGEVISLKDAVLSDDGSILINNKKVYSIR